MSTPEPPIRPWLPDALARLTHLTELGANWDRDYDAEREGNGP